MRLPLGEVWQMTKFADEVAVRAARFAKADGHCECHGVGCTAGTHMYQALPKGIGMTHGGCSAPVARDMGASTNEGADVLATRVILMHSYDDATDSANLRIYCAPCAEQHERAIRS